MRIIIAPLLTFRTSSGTAVEATANSADRRNCRYVRSDAAWIWRNGYYPDVYVSIVARPMASSDHNKLKNDQDKLAWVMPIIGLLEAGHTLGKLSLTSETTSPGPNKFQFGPS